MKNPRTEMSGRSGTVWRDYLLFYRGFERPVAATAIVSALQSLLVLPAAWLIRRAFDRSIPTGDTAGLVLAGGAIALLALLESGSMLWTRRIILRTTKLVIRRFRETLVRKIYSLPRSYYTGADSGKLHDIVVQDTERLDIMTNALIAQVFPSAIAGLLLAAVLFSLDEILFLAMISTAPLMLLINRKIGRKVRRETQLFHRSFGAFSRGILFVLEMMDLTRVQAAEDDELRKQVDHIEDLRRTSGHMAWLRAAYVAAQNATVAISAVVILIVGGISVVNGRMSLGSLLAFYAVVALLRSQLQTIAACIPLVIEGLASLLTLQGVLEAEGRLPYAGTGRCAFQGGIGLEGVTFGYGTDPILRDINLCVNPSETIAIVGPSGSGKTTIANLILGFYHPQEGRLCADGRPYDELDLTHLRKQFGVVLQDPLVFEGSVLENIRYGHPEAAPDEIARAVETAMADLFIRKLPRGLETEVGEDGVLLSGGERQRVALARAFLGWPRLLILDEPGNHLDGDAVRTIIGRVRASAPRPAVIVFSHSGDLPFEVDRVYTLKCGSLVPGISVVSNLGPVPRTDKGLAEDDVGH